jgi:hypothetical protein
VNHLLFSSLLAAVALALSLAGCNNTAQEAAQEASNIKPLAIFYGQYVGRHQGQPPPNEAEFKAFVKENPAIVQGLSIADPEGLFISSRDNKPYVVIYGAATGPPGPGSQPVVIYEQEGVNGMRYVASSLGAVEEVDDAKFRQYVPQAP